MPFLSKYNSAFGGSSRLIVPSRDFICDVMQMALRKTKAASNLDTFKQTVGQWVSDLVSSDEANESET